MGKTGPNLHKKDCNKAPPLQGLFQALVFTTVLVNGYCLFGQ